MASKYEYLIKRLHDVAGGVVGAECNRAVIKKLRANFPTERPATTPAEAAIFGVADAAREAVAGDPDEWYVLDKDGDKVHIGNMVVGGNYRGQGSVFALGRNCLAVKDSFGCDTLAASECKKIGRDSWEPLEYGLELAKETGGALFQETLNEMKEAAAYLDSLIEECERLENQIKPTQELAERGQ